MGTLRFQTGGFSTAGEEGSGGFGCWARVGIGVTSKRAAIRTAGLTDAILCVENRRQRSSVNIRHNGVLHGILGGVIVIGCLLPLPRG
jgi:hypothetical protein